MEESHKYDDIIELEHPVSKRHPRMSMTERAAQFAPFAALTGYDAMVRKTAADTALSFDATEADDVDWMGC